MLHRPYRTTCVLLILISGLLPFLGPSPLLAASAGEINVRVNATLNEFYGKVGAARELSRKAEGLLFFPSVIKAGFGIGGEYGEGALRVGGKTVAYYSTAGISFGFQLGAQSKAIILMFLTSQALSDFRNSQGWEVGVDGSVALIELGAGESIDTSNIQDPIVGFVFGQKGLMYNLTLEGTKMTRIQK